MIFFQLGQHQRFFTSCFQKNLKLHLRGSLYLASWFERWRQFSNMIGGEPRGWPLGLHTSGQTPKVKGLQSAYMATLFGIFGAKSLTSQQEFWSSKNRNPNSNQEAKLFFNKLLRLWQNDTNNIFWWTFVFTFGEEFGVWPLTLTGQVWRGR